MNAWELRLLYEDVIILSSGCQEDVVLNTTNATVVCSASLILGATTSLRMSLLITVLVT